MEDEAELPEAGDARPPRRADRPPVFNLPRVLAIVLVLLILVYVVQDYLLDEGQRQEFMLAFAFTPLRYVYPLAEQDLAWLWTPVTYSLMHGGIEHLLFNALWLMAFGAPVARRIGTWRFALFWAVSAAAAAFFHAALNWGGENFLIGASGVVAALTGAACRFAFPARRGYDLAWGHLYPRQPVLVALANRTVAIFTAIWLIGNLLVAVGINLLGQDLGPIAWDAHIGGFLFGFLLFGLFDPKRAPSRRQLPL